MGKRILVANGSFGDRIALRDLLVSLGYHIVGQTARGRGLLEKYKDLKPDLVVLDAKMPDMDCISVIQELLLTDHEANILICVARGQRAIATEAIQAGAVDFITKPIDPRRLRKAVRGLIG